MRLGREAQPVPGYAQERWAIRFGLLIWGILGWFVLSSMVNKMQDRAVREAHEAQMRIETK